MENEFYEDEKWYPILSDLFLNSKGYEVSDYGRMRNKRGRLLKPRNYYSNSKSRPGTYSIRTTGINKYYNSFELMCLNIPSLNNEGHYLVSYILEQDESNIYKNKIHPIWSKSSEDEKWTYLEDLDIYISEKYDILDPNKLRCAQICTDDNGYKYFFCSKLKRNVYMSRLIYILFHIHEIKNIKKYIIDRTFYIGYKDGDNGNFEPSNLILKGGDIE